MGGNVLPIHNSGNNYTTIVGYRRVLGEKRLFNR